jgi:hypothetical protein
MPKIIFLMKTKWFLYIFLIVFLFCNNSCDNDASRSSRVDYSQIERETVNNSIPKKHSINDIARANTNEENHMPQMQYSLVIGVSSGDLNAELDDDIHLPTGGGSIGGEILIFINESPFGHLLRGSRVYPIYPFLEPGTNRIRIEGKHEKGIYIKVVALDPATLMEYKKTMSGEFHFEHVLGKKILNPSEEVVNLEFDIPGDKRPDYEELPTDAKEKEVVIKELNQLLDNVFIACNTHDADGVLNLICPSLKSPPPYFETISILKQKQAPLVSVISNPNYKLLTKREDVKFIYGKRTVLLYSEKLASRMAILFHFETDDTNLMPQFNWSDITLVRMEGKWIFQ